MTDEILKLYQSRDALCADGRMWLSDRCLSINESIKRGVASRDGMMYFIYTMNGEPVRWKARSMTDKKKQFMSKLDDSIAPDFKMPFFSHFKDPTSSDLFITEGELDSIALAQLGASNCVSLPNGCGSVETSFRNHYDFLQQFERIFICFDMDKPGEEAAQKALQLISPAKYRRINFPCKDANDWLIEHSPCREEFDILIENAKKIETNCATNLLDLPDSFYGDVNQGISSGWQKLDHFLGGLRTGEVTVISADTGAGKSTFCLNLFKNIAERGHGIWINSYELDPQMVNRKFASTVLGEKLKYESFRDNQKSMYKHWLSHKKCFINLSTEKVDIATLRNQFEMVSLIHNVKYILIDHLDYIHTNGKNKSTLENIDEAIRELHIMAMEFKVGVFLVVHPKQVPEGQEITMQHLKGSSSIKQYADNILILSKMDRIDPGKTGQLSVKVSKNRFAGVEGRFFLKYMAESDGYVENFI